MDTKLPRLRQAAATGVATLRLEWGDSGTDEVNLAGWIATGGEILAPLKDPEIFAAARLGDHGASVEWGEDDDLAIDAHHLQLIANEQRPFGPAEMEAWQKAMGLSNQEAADLLGVVSSTWHLYKTKGPVPAAVAMLCRAAARDPLLMQAHYRPRPKAGRPRRAG